MTKKSQDYAFGELDEYSSDMQEQFEQSITAFNQAKWGQPFQVLVESGIRLPAPAELADSELVTTLWQVIDALALMGIVLEHTDHLSDRELYTVLWNDCLREETVFQSQRFNMICHIDLIGSGNEEDMRAYLRFYADEQERSEWVKEFPDYILPSSEKPHYERDHKLPKLEHSSKISVH